MSVKVSGWAHSVEIATCIGYSNEVHRKGKHGGKTECLKVLSL